MKRLDRLEDCIVTLSKREQTVWVCIGFLLAFFTFTWLFRKRYVTFFKREDYLTTKNLYRYLKNDGDNIMIPKRLKYKDYEVIEYRFGKYSIQISDYGEYEHNTLAIFLYNGDNCDRCLVSGGLLDTDYAYKKYYNYCQAELTRIAQNVPLTEA